MRTEVSTFERYRTEAADDPGGFWGRAAEIVPWSRRWERVFVPDPPSFRWFVGGRTNLARNAVDRHVEEGRADARALVYLSENGDRRELTYGELLDAVRRVSAALRTLGIRRGDRVTIYMPTCVEAIVGMLATVRIGAIHSVVFAGFGAGALAQRIRASGSRVVLTADVTWRKGRSVPLEPIVDEALATDPGEVEHVVVLRRGDAPDSRGVSGSDGPYRKADWDAFVAGGDGAPDGPEEMEANDPAFILATSGTTAAPKLAVHVHGGYQVHIAAMGDWVFGLRADDVWWSASDIGWIVGHGYIVYAPLLAGCTTLAYEGAIDHPQSDQLWRLIEELRVTGLFTSPTGVRLLMRYGSEGPRSHDLSSVQRVVCAGEVLNAPAWAWLQQDVFGDRIPVIDHMWQTETGGPIFGNPWGLGVLPVRPGSAGLPLPGIEARIVAPDGSPVATGEKGIMVIDRPFPGLTPALWNDPERYARDYWSRIPGAYYVGDAAHVDQDGYVWFAGRADEIIKISSHRLGTIEVETAFLRHPAVAEAGVTGRPDDVRGEVIAAFIVLKVGHEPSEDLRRELLATLRNELGPVATVGELTFVDILPKTRSGKIMRRVLKAVVLGRDPGDITTIEDEGSVEEAREAHAQLTAALGGRQG